MMRKILRVMTTLLVVALAAAAGYWLWQHYMLAPWTRDARVRADVVTLAPDVSGWVADLKVHDNQKVAQGELLFEIDRARYEAALEQAQALAETRRQQLEQARREADRRQRLGRQAISEELRDNASIAAAIAKAQYREAQAEVRVAEINLERSRVYAPRAGQITNLRLVQGNYVNAGQAVMALVADDSFYIQAYFEETKLPRIRVGAPVKVWLMSGGKPLSGHVASLSEGITDRNASPDSQLLADVEPTFNWVRLAQRIPVRIQLDEWPEDVHVAAGMTASVQVDEEDAAAQ